MFNPELYVGAYELRNKETGQTKMMCGMYRDLLNNPAGYAVDTNFGSTFDDERLVYYCVSVPGENQWVKNLYKEQSLLSYDQLSSGRSAGKRSQNDCDEEEMDVVIPPTISPETLDNPINKRLKKTENMTQETSTQSSYCPQLYIPWPDESAVAAIVKVYDASEYSLNDMVEFVGIISMDPQLTNFSEDDRNMGDSFGLLQMEEEEYQNPPPSLVPRLHVLKGFLMTHNNPHLPSQVTAEDVSAMTTSCQNIRAELHSILTNELNGDSLAADYLLCHLISFMDLKVNASMPGKFSLNLTNVSECGNDFVGRLYKMLSSLATKSVLVPISLENLNSWNFIPTKDYQANRLVSGRLQLSKHTHFIVDETVLSEGQLQAKGVQNVGALERLIQHQEVSYDFNYNKIEFQTDIPVLILSEKKSILSVNFILPIVSKEHWNYRTESISHLLPKFRTYITVLRLLNYNHTFDDEIQTLVSDFFVEERQKDVKKMTEGILHDILNMTKLLSLSYGENKLSKETWKKALELETARKSRL
ncbi:hypothetical protein CHUAL_010130 [Chamberlinius hualienensis]